MGFIVVLLVLQELVVLANQAIRKAFIAMSPQKTRVVDNRNDGDIQRSVVFFLSY